MSSSLLLFPQRFGRYVLRPSSGDVAEFDKHLKKARGHISRNVVEITIKMKTVIRKPLMTLNHTKNSLDMVKQKKKIQKRNGMYFNCRENNALEPIMSKNKLQMCWRKLRFIYVVIDIKKLKHYKRTQESDRKEVTKHYWAGRSSSGMCAREDSFIRLTNGIRASQKMSTIIISS